MKRIADINRSKHTITALSAVIFLVMLVFNFMTPYIADDYVYIYSFVDAAPMESISQIIPSMQVHSRIMNGRVISHGLEQLFMIYPKALFNVFNALIFVGCVYYIYKICMPKKKHNAAAYLAVFMALWYFVPVFGQVFLWQVGSVNYAWALFFSLVFVYQYVKAYKNKEPMMKNTVVFVFFNIFAFLLGMYSEVASFIAIMAAALLVVLSRVIDKEKITVRKVLPIVFAAIGFVVLLKMPVELSAKMSDGLSPMVIIDNIVTCTQMLEEFFVVLLVVWACALVMSLYNKKKKSFSNVILSLVFVFLGICANYVMIVGSYFPERSFFVAAVMLIVANLVLLVELLESSMAVGVSALAAVLCVVFMFSFIYGAYDIYNCKGAFDEREEYIFEMKGKGETNLDVNVVLPNTRHSAFYGITDIAVTSTTDWPNMAVSMYYGIDSIIGVR